LSFDIASCSLAAWMVTLKLNGFKAVVDMGVNGLKVLGFVYADKIGHLMNERLIMGKSTQNE
jgi:hypothetical protein